VKSVSYKLASVVVITVLLLLALNFTGCAHPPANAKLQIIPMSNHEIADLRADDIVLIMRRAGFSDDQILELGPDLREGLLESGAAQFKVGNKIEAIFAIHGDCVYVSTRMRGSFIYDVKIGSIV